MKCWYKYELFAAKRYKPQQQNMLQLLQSVATLSTFDQVFPFFILKHYLKVWFDWLVTRILSFPTARANTQMRGKRQVQLQHELYPPPLHSHLICIIIAFPLTRGMLRIKADCSQSKQTGCMQLHVQRQFFSNDKSQLQNYNILFTKVLLLRTHALKE